MVVAAIVDRRLYPALCSSSQVRPSEQTKESPYLQRNIDGDPRRVRARRPSRSSRTRRRPSGRARALADDAETTASIRLLDPASWSPDLPPAAADPAVLQLPGLARRRPLHDRRRGARHRHRGPRARPRRSAREPAQLGQRPHRLHPRLRRGRRLRQPARRRRRAGVLPGGHPVQRRARRLRAADLLRRAVAQFSIVGAPDGSAPRELDFPTDEGERLGPGEHHVRAATAAGGRHRAEPRCSTRSSSRTRTSCCPTR